MPGWVEEAQGRTVNEMLGLFSCVAEQFRDLLGRTPDPDKTIIIEHLKYGYLDTHISDFLSHEDQPRDVLQGQCDRDAEAARRCGGHQPIIFFI